MEVSTLSYLALSRLSWDDLQYTQAHKNQTIAQLIQGGVYGGIGSELLSILNNASAEKPEPEPTKKSKKIKSEPKSKKRKSTKILGD